MTTKFLSDAQLEDMAAGLLGRYESLFGTVTSPPVPVERILEDVLDFRILWDPIPEPPGQSILAALEPGSKTVVFNEPRRALIDETQGLYNTVLAHEAGHWVPPSGCHICSGSSLASRPTTRKATPDWAC